ADSTSTRQHGGLGLGLAIVRHLVEIHGGTVRVTSPGENLGATFSISLPLLRTLDLAPVSIEKPEELSTTEGTPLINMSEKSSNGNVRLDGRRVLIVDDDQD